MILEGLTNREKLHRVYDALEYVLRGGNLAPEDKMQIAICADIIEEIANEEE